MANVIKLNNRDLGRLIKECVARVLNEGYEGLCSKLTAYQKKFGDIRQRNLPDGVAVTDISNEDIVRLTTDPKREDKYTIKFANGYYAVISPDSETIVNAEKRKADFEDMKARREAEIAAMPVSQLKQIPYETPEETKEKRKKERERERGFSSMKKVQEYIEEKYGEHLELLTVRTRRGREFVYQARITFVASSYADGPSYVEDECIEDVTKYLEPFGFYYAGSREDHDERQWSTNGWHVWKRRGAIDPYERYLMRQDDEDEWGW